MMPGAHGGGPARSDCIADTDFVQNLQQSGASSQHRDPSSCRRDHIGLGRRTRGTRAFGYLRTYTVTDVPCSKILMLLKCLDFIGIGVFAIPFFIFLGDHNVCRGPQAVVPHQCDSESREGASEASMLILAFPSQFIDPSAF